MIYEYKCLECGTKYEKMHGMNLKPEFHCEVETCNGVLIKIPVSCQFKISGDSSLNEWGNKPQKVSGEEFSQSLSD